MIVEVIVKEERDDGRMVERALPHASRAQGPADLEQTRKNLRETRKKLGKT